MKTTPKTVVEEQSPIQEQTLSRHSLTFQPCASVLGPWGADVENRIHRRDVTGDSTRTVAHRVGRDFDLVHKHEHEHVTEAAARLLRRGKVSDG